MSFSAIYAFSKLFEKEIQPVDDDDHATATPVNYPSPKRAAWRSRTEACRPFLLLCCSITLYCRSYLLCGVCVVSGTDQKRELASFSSATSQHAAKSGVYVGGGNMLHLKRRHHEQRCCHSTADMSSERVWSSHQQPSRLGTSARSRSTRSIDRSLCSIVRA